MKKNLVQFMTHSSDWFRVSKKTRWTDSITIQLASYVEFLHFFSLHHHALQHLLLEIIDWSVKHICKEGVRKSVLCKDCVSVYVLMYSDFLSGKIKSGPYCHFNLQITTYSEWNSVTTHLERYIIFYTIWHCT